MNQNQKEFLSNMQRTKPGLWLRFVDINRKIYNRLCRECQVNVVKKGGNVRPQDLCGDCNKSYVQYAEQLKTIIRQAGGVTDEKANTHK